MSDRDRSPVESVNHSAKPLPPQLLETARRELADQTRRGNGGSAALERYADRVDELLRQLCAEAPSPSQPVGVFALGGYGRRQLCLHSDVDVLVLFGGAIREAEERFLRAFLHPLWDLGFVVGHQVRELQDFERLETGNPEFLLALVDARQVAGDPTLFDRFLTAFHTPAAHAFIVDALSTLIDERHAKFNDTIYQLEPDIKDAPGALRDLMATRTIVALTDPALLRYGPSDAVRLGEAEEFLLRVRSILHLDAKRNHNELSHQMQDKVADLFGYPGALPQQPVEKLMSDYFRHARIVSRSLEWVRRAAPVPVGHNLGHSFDGIRFIDLRQAAIQPATWLAAFQVGIDRGAPVSNEALACIQQHAERFTPEEFFPTPEHRDALLRFLKPRAGLYARLSQLHDCGLLGRMFPEFQKIASRVVRDFYHKYTVDEHTLLTIRNLERLSAFPPGRERFASLLQDLEAPELLVLALLFHDVGKWRDEDHAVESVRMAESVFDRLKLPVESRELVVFLIRDHLRMSQVAFRRDTEDPEIVRRFAELVGVETRLKMLCLLTLADIEAVSLETLTPWKEELLWRLYVDTYNQLTLGYGDELIDRGQTELAKLLASRPADLSEAEITSFLEGFPRRYLQLFDREATYRHVRLSRDIHPDTVHLWLEHKGSLWELTVVTLDKAFLFSNICGVLSSFGMDIVRGHAMTNPNGLVLDSFQFTDRERFLELILDAREQFFHVLEDVVSGRADARARLRGREQSVVHQRQMPRSNPVIHADNQSSRRYTILDIITGDELGLLYRISRVISEHGCAVDLVLISTEGQKAIDVFHLTKDRAKLSDADQLALTDHLQRMLEGSDEAH